MANVQIFHLAVTKKSREVGRRLVKELLLEAEVQAKVQTMRGPYSTGRLADSIHIQGPHDTALGIKGSLGTHLSYAHTVHNGSGLYGPKHKAYSIFPKRAMKVYRFGSRRKPQLHFFWRKAGKMVFLPHIPGAPGTVGLSHPGQRGQHFLTNALKDAARRKRFRVFIYDR